VCAPLSMVNLAFWCSTLHNISGAQLWLHAPNAYSDSHFLNQLWVSYLFKIRQWLLRSHLAEMLRRSFFIETAMYPHGEGHNWLTLRMK